MNNAKIHTIFEDRYASVALELEEATLKHILWADTFDFHPVGYLYTSQEPVMFLVATLVLRLCSSTTQHCKLGLSRNDNQAYRVCQVVLT